MWHNLHTFSYPSKSKITENYLLLPVWSSFKAHSLRSQNRLVHYQFVRDGFKTQPPVDRQFRPVPASFYCSKQWQPPGTGRNRWSTGGWVLKPPLTDYSLFMGGIFREGYTWFQSRGGSHIDMVQVYVPAFWGAISLNLVERSVDFHQRWRSPNYINWVYIEQIMAKSTQFEQSWVLIVQKICMEKVKFSRFSRHIHVQFPPGFKACKLRLK